jgi:hypothetical protein
MASKKDILTNICLLYWLYDEVPDLSATSTDDTVKRLLKVYDSLKSDALSKYPWRSAIKYVELTPTEPTTSADGRYTYTVDLPTDFLKEEGFWENWDRTTPCPQSVEIVGRTAKTNLTKFTLGYISSDIQEENLDSWVCKWLEIYIASEASRLAGVPVDQINYLMQKQEIDFMKLSNTDWRNAHHDDDNTATLGQFLDY